MKLVRMNSGEIGLFVELPAGPHVLDIAKSLAVFAAHDPASGALVNGTLKEKSAWVALVNNWRYLRKPLALLARAALANSDDPRLVLYPLARARQMRESPPGIVALDITDAADLEIHDPTGRLVMARQFAESAAEPAEPQMSSMGENVQVVDFSRHK
ncbi:MAG TPA: hypothetical protein VNY08_11900 [Bradyrhizobium sp.]|jgi:hypothetical protein|nr:hypothetical protein [Bradyrhizobium sp.]